MTVVAMTHNWVCKFRLEKSQERIADLQYVAATETQYTTAMNWNFKKFSWKLTFGLQLEAFLHKALVWQTAAQTCLCKI